MRGSLGGREEEGSFGGGRHGGWWEEEGEGGKLNRSGYSRGEGKKVTIIVAVESGSRKTFQSLRAKGDAQFSMEPKVYKMEPGGERVVTE